MIKSGSRPGLAAIGAKIQFLARFKWFFSVLIAVLFTTMAATPPDQQTPDEQYIHIMNIIDRADALRKAGQLDAAKVKYREAQTNLLYFKAYNPLFAPKTVAYRLNEVSDILDTRPPVKEDATPAAKPKPKPEAESSAPGSKSSVKLIDAGAEPRSVLRLHVQPGEKQTAIMTMKMNMEMPGMGGAGAGAKAPKLPAMTIPTDFTVQSVAPNGDITYTAVVGEPGIQADPGTTPQVAEAMKQALAKIKGLTSTGIISSRGVSKRVEMKAPADADPQLRQSLDQMKEAMANLAVPVPDEAVGAGAKWEVQVPVKTQGMTIEQTATYQLVSVAGDHVNASVALVQNAANQKIQNPGMAGAQMNLIQLTGKGTGNITADLSKLVPAQASIDMHMEMNSELTMGTKKQPIALKMDINVTTEAR
jgi:hypothetical protein